MTVRANNAAHQASSSTSSATATSSSTRDLPSFVLNYGPGSNSDYGASWVTNNHLGIMVQCFAGSSDSRRGSGHFIRRIEKVKFGVPVAEAFSHDIPATLLVLMLKVNKQGPAKRDIWRAPGNQAHVRKLIHVMQHGRLVNIENYSVYTAASVIKKFLTKIPGGIFGPVNEERLFELLNFDDPDKQREAFCRVVSSLPVPSQHLLVLLIGTFRLIADAAETTGMHMSPDAIGVSVAPSLFHSCIHDGQRAKMADIARFHMASKVLSFLVQSFGYTNLFPRDNYEFYARMTGRTLRVDENWRFSFQYPSKAFSQPDVVVTPEHDAAAEEQFQRITNSAELTTTAVSLDELKRINKLAESTKSLSYLEWVHERQTQRMQSRSEWFLSPDPYQKQPTGSRTIDSVSPTSPTAYSPRYFSERHGSLPADSASACDEEAGTSSSPARAYHPPSPLQYYRYHNYNPQHWQKAAAKMKKGSETTLAHLSPTITQNVRPLADIEDQPSADTAGSSGQSPVASGTAPVIRRQSWRIYYTRPYGTCAFSADVKTSKEDED